MLGTVLRFGLGGVLTLALIYASWWIWTTAQPLLRGRFARTFGENDTLSAIDAWLRGGTVADMRLVFALIAVFVFLSVAEFLFGLVQRLHAMVTADRE